MRRWLLLTMLSGACALLAMQQLHPNSSEWGIEAVQAVLELADDIPGVDALLAKRAHAADDTASGHQPETGGASASAVKEQDGPPVEQGAAAGAIDASAPPQALAQAAQGGPVRLELLARTRDLGEVRDAFGAKSWVIVPPPPPAAPPPPPEAPRAPPLPFRYMGQLDDGSGKPTYFLVRGTASLSVTVGERIDNTYLLERAENGALVFNFLPLKERQSLTIGVGP